MEDDEERVDEIGARRPEGSTRERRTGCEEEERGKRNKAEVMLSDTRE